MIDISFFMNDKWKIIKVIYDNQMEIEGQKVCPLNQQEIANLAFCSKVKTNQTINEMINQNYIKPTRLKGRYKLQEKGNEILEFVLQLEKN